MKTIQIPIEKITIDTSLQLRASIHEDAVAEYAEAYRDKTSMPAVDVFKNGSGFTLANGFHRLAAAKVAGLKTIQCVVHVGDRQAMFKCAIDTNRAHGIRFTNVDKRNAVRKALKEWPAISDRAIAKLCFVTHPFVAEVRGQLETLPVEKKSKSANEPVTKDDPETRIGLDGKKRSVPNAATPPPRRSSFDPDTKPRNNDFAYISGPVGNGVPHGTFDEREEIDLADVMPRPTKEDIALAKEFGGYPKSVTYILTNEDEENATRESHGKMLSERSVRSTLFDAFTVKSIPPPGTIVSECIAKLCQVYKEATKKKLSTSGADRGQLSRLIEGLGWDSVDEIADVFRKACLRSVSDIRPAEKFWSEKAHQIVLFVKHYGMIRNEATAPKHQTILDKQKEAGGLKGQAYAASVRTVGS